MPNAQQPLLTADNQIASLKSQGVRFELRSEESALLYLRANTNYFRLKSYKQGFERVVGGPHAGNYVGLDFEMLVDLSIIDMLLRNELLPMALDIEHYAKVRLLNAAEGQGEDGYAIVHDFLEASGPLDQENNKVIHTILRGKSSPYVADLIAEHPQFDYPIWKFVEIVPFGTFINFYRSCGRRFNRGDMEEQYYLLLRVRGLRNGCAHNNCIINDMRKGGRGYRPPHEVSRALSKIGVSRDMRRTKLGNERLQQVATTFYLHRMWSSPGILTHRAISLHAFRDRMYKHVDYYAHNSQVVSGFEFFAKMIDGWYPESLCGEQSP